MDYYEYLIIFSKFVIGTKSIQMAQLNYPIGIQTFDKIIKGKYIYIDKTDLIHSIAKRYTYVFLSRPRRFGKSLLTSTFESYFKGERELFKGLALSGLKTSGGGTRS